MTESFILIKMDTFFFYKFVIVNCLNGCFNMKSKRLNDHLDTSVFENVNENIFKIYVLVM